MYTREERKASAAAKKLGNALLAIEDFEGDPSMIFDDVEIYFSSPEIRERYSLSGAKAAMKALREHYETPSLTNEEEMKLERDAEFGGRR